MLILNGFFKDNRVIPEDEVVIPDGTKARISVEESPQGKINNAEETRQAWQEFFEAMDSIEGEELGEEFDSTIAEGLSFREL
jgi:hypothetical protein